MIKKSGQDLYICDEGESHQNIEVVRYEKNRKKGTAKVTFRGLPGTKFGGIKTVTFKITPKQVIGNIWEGVIDYIWGEILN